MAALPDFGEARGSVWQSFIIFPLRLSACGREPGLQQTGWQTADIPKVLRDVLR